MKKLLVINYHRPPGKKVFGSGIQQLVEHLPPFGRNYRILTIRRGTKDKKAYGYQFLAITACLVMVLNTVSLHRRKEHA